MPPLTTPIVAAYFPEWGIYGRDVQIADVPADRLTHLIYAFTRIGPDGRIQLFDAYAATEKRFTDPEDAVGGIADRWSYPPEDPRSGQTVFGNINQIAALKAAHPHLRTSVAIGGWTLSGNFSTTFDTASEREVFTESVVEFLRTHRVFDGVDFDWEYPGGGGLESNAVSPTDGANYVATLRLLRQKLDGLGAELGRRYEISVASAAGIDKIPAFQLSDLKEVVDFFNVMTYDFHGTWETSTGHQAPLRADGRGYDITTAVDRYLQAGVDPARIVLGVPAYTRAWRGVQSSPDATGADDYGHGDVAAGAAPGSFEAGVYDYKDLLARLRGGGWQLIWDDNAQAASLWNPAEAIFSSFETPATMALKSAWAREQGLGGVMVWDLSNDALGDRESLIEAAAQVWLDGRAFAEIDAASALRFDAIVGGNGRFDLADALQGATTRPPLIAPPQPPAPVPAPAASTPITPTPAPLPAPTPALPTPTPTASSDPIAVELTVTGQWSGAFEGQLALTNQGSTPLQAWSASFRSHHALRSVSEFSLEQSRQADGSWLVTVRPPSWGATLLPGVASRSYLQGVLPEGGSEVPPGVLPAVPGPAAVDPIVGGAAGTAPLTDVLVGSADSRIQARADRAERLRLGYAWGRQLTVEGFDPLQDRLDLRGFWGEGAQARVLGSAEGVRVELPFNQQQILLSGVGLEQWQPHALEIWAA